MKKRHTNIPSAFLILVQEHKILLGLRQNTGAYDGEWGLVSGHVDAGETFTDAIIREAKEEAGIDIITQDLSLAHVMHKKSDVDGSERVDTFFFCQHRIGEVENKEPKKCKKLERFGMDELPENTCSFVRDAIGFSLQNIVYSEWGWKK